MSRRRIVRTVDRYKQGFVYHIRLNGAAGMPQLRSRTYCPFKAMGFGDRFFYPLNPKRSVYENRYILGNAVSRQRSDLLGFWIEEAEYGWWVICEPPTPRDIKRRKERKAKPAKTATPWFERQRRKRLARELFDH